MFKRLSSTVFGPPGKHEEDDSTEAGASEEAIGEDVTSNASTDSAPMVDACCPLGDRPPVAAQEPERNEHTATSPQGAPRDKRTAPAHTADRQASRRAAKRYRLLDGRWVKGKVAADGESWTPHESPQAFGSLQAAMEHERLLTAQRRATWTNLRAHIASTRSAVGAEAVATRARVSEEAVLTRNEVQSARDTLSQQLQEATGKILGSQRTKQSNTSQVAFVSKLLGLRAVELKELLTRHCIEPIGTKQSLAELAASELLEGDLEDFIAARKKPRRDADVRRPTARGQQDTLDAFFARKHQ